MAPKRKKTWPQSPSASPNARPRSSRKSAALDTTSVSDTDSQKTQDHSRGPSMGSMAHKQEDVDRAKRHLREMEEQLQSAVRRERLAIESSTFDIPDNDGAINASKNIQTPHEQTCPTSDNTSPKGDSVDRGARRPPPVNSEVLPLPWAGRLGYACLNTYLRAANPPVFSSRTCRISSILEHQHPLRDITLPEHPTKNRPDKSQPSSEEHGLKYLQDIGLANARDIPKMIRWNCKYGIRFMRLSSEMFPFASHEVYGYRLAPFASETLAEAGKVAAELGHRLTMHPGQFTQVGSPRKEVVEASIRDLEYHDELLSLLKLPPQMDRDAVMILHMGGVYGDKQATVGRFRNNYAKLSDGVKKRLVLENDDVSWSVHDLLPICEELNIPLVLDFHHHNIIFDPSIREGTLDIIDFFERIRNTWTRKNIRQKMHYSEPTAGAVTSRDRRKHSPRVKTLPPCPKDMDLMIEAKDKEQAVFQLMRSFALPGCNLFNNIVPHERDDEPRKAMGKSVKGSKKNESGQRHENEAEVTVEKIITPEEFGMGGPENRVFWPEGIEEWLRPRKREVKPSA